MEIFIDIVVVSFLLLLIVLGYKKGLVKVVIKFLAFVLSIIVMIFAYRPVADFIINNTALDETIQNAIYEKAMESIQNKEANNSLVESAVNGTLPEAAGNLSRKIIYIGTLIVLFIVLRITLGLILKVFNGISKLPILRQFNGIGGGVFGALKGVLIVFIALIILDVANVLYPQNDINKYIQKTYVTKVFYENNLVKQFLKI